MDFMAVNYFNTELDAIQRKITEVKREVMAGLVMKTKEFSSWQVDLFKADLKVRVFKCKEYGDRLSKEMRSTTILPGSEINTIPYDQIKELIFITADYRSIVGYMVGLVNGVENGELDKPEDINDFFSHTIEKAYHLNVESTGELIEKCQFIVDGKEPMSQLDRKLFESLRAYPELFKMTDAGVIFTSASKSLTALIRYLSDHTNISTAEGLKLVQIVNSFFDYMMFTVISFVSRAFLIGYYFAPIWQAAINPNNSDKVMAYQEAAELDAIPADLRFTPLLELDRSKVITPDTLMQVLGVYSQLVTRVGAGGTKGLPNGDDLSRGYAWDNTNSKAAVKRVIADSGLVDNTMIAKVIFNDVYYYSYAEQRAEVPLNVTELYHNLKSSVNNSKQALKSQTSAKDDILRVIAFDEGVKSLADLRKLAADGYLLTGGILSSLRDQLLRIEGVTNEQYSDRTLGNSKLLSEIHMMLLELYRDIATAAYDRAVMIDRLYVRLTEKQTDLMTRSTEININKLMSSGMEGQVPDTLRGSSDLLPRYQQPLVESYLFQNEYLRSCTEFMGDRYLTEAGLADIIAVIRSLIEGIIASIAGFAKNFKPAAAWVTKNVDPKTMTFPETAKISGVYLYDVREYRTALKGLTLDSIKANFDKPGDEFTASLYGSNEIYEKFKNDKTKAAIAWRNSRLFNVKKEDAPVGTVAVSGKDIQAKLTEWVADVIAGDSIMADLTKTATAMKEIVKYLNTEAVKPPTTASVAAAAPDDAPELKADKAADAKPAEKPSAAPAGNKPAPVADDRITRVQNAINNLWLPVYQGIIKSLRDEYSYIKQAVTLHNQQPVDDGTKPVEKADKSSGV